MSATRFVRPDVEAPLVVWEYVIALERMVVAAEAERDELQQLTAYDIRDVKRRADAAEARLATLKAALEKIASVPCQIACASLPGATRCVTCVARAALQEETP